MRAYIYLAVAIASEVAGTSALKASDGFTNLLPSLVVVVGYASAFYLLSLTLQELPVGMVYAIWAGLGVVGVAAVGVVVFGEQLDLAAVVGTALIVAGVAVLSLYSSSYSPAH